MWLVKHQRGTQVLYRSSMEYNSGYQRSVFGNSRSYKITSYVQILEFYKISEILLRPTFQGLPFDTSSQVHCNGLSEEGAITAGYSDIN